MWCHFDFIILVLNVFILLVQYNYTNIRSEDENTSRMLSTRVQPIIIIRQMPGPGSCPVNLFKLTLNSFVTLKPLRSLWTNSRSEGVAPKPSY